MTTIQKNDLNRAQFRSDDSAGGRRISSEYSTPSPEKSTPIAIAVSNSRAELGKIPLGDPAWGAFNGSFRNVNITPEKLGELIQQGYAYTTQHTDYRKAENFVQGQHLALDFDTGDELSSIAVLTQDPFIARHAAFIHTTPSHKPEQPRARVIIPLDRPVKDGAKYAELAQALVWRFPIADQSAKDIARFFYGSKGCEVLWLGNTLTLEDAARELILPYRAAMETLQKVVQPGAIVTSSDVPEKVREKHRNSLLDGVQNAPDGEKYVTLRNTAITFGGYIAGGYYNRLDVTNWLQGAIRNNRNNVKDLNAAYQTIDEGISYGEKQPLYFSPPSTNGATHNAAANGATKNHTDQETNTRQYRSDDTGNAERFTDQHGDRVRYVYAWGEWLIWDGTRWKTDGTGEVERLAKLTARSLLIEVGELGAAGRTEQAESLAKWAAQSGNASRRAAMMTLARSELPIATKPEDLDTHPLLLNCANGTLNLATGELLPHDPAHLITKCLSIPYDAAATCPLWFKFLARIFDNDQGMIGLMQKIFGLSLSGVTIQKLFFWFGLGANGKSVAGETLLSLLGDYATKTPAETLLMRDKSAIPNDLAALSGARVVIASELPEGRRLNESMIKDMTGGDRLSVRHLYGKFFTLTPEFKLVMYGNHKPVISGTDNGIWRRVILMPFNVQIPEHEQDPELPAKLRAELPGILAWAVKGWQMYQSEGLTPPAAAKQATESYRAESDLLGQFLAECTVQGAGLRAVSGELLTDYGTYTGQTLSTVKFARLLQERGFTKTRGTEGHEKGKTIWLGLGRVATVGTPPDIEKNDVSQEIPGFDITNDDWENLASELGGVAVCESSK